MDRGAVNMKKKISVFNVGTGQWEVVNKETNKYAYIYSISEYNAFTKIKKRYRVDVNGITVDSLIEHFQSAKSIAIKHVQ